jgi:PhnB protein
VETTTMKRLIPYLSFGGRCEAALQFYAEVFGGRVNSLTRMGDLMEQATEAQKKWVVHSEFEAEGLFFMASDGAPDGPPPSHGPVALALMLESVEEQDRVWAHLVEGGTVSHPLHVAFYGGRFGALRDRFGVEWKLNCNPPKK